MVRYSSLRMILCEERTSKYWSDNAWLNRVPNRPCASTAPRRRRSWTQKATLTKSGARSVCSRRLKVPCRCSSSHSSRPTKGRPSSRHTIRKSPPVVFTTQGETCEDSGISPAIDASGPKAPGSGTGILVEFLAIAVGREHPHAPVVGAVPHLHAEPQSQPEQAEDHFVAPGHLPHHEHHHRKQDDEVGVDVERQQQATAAGDRERHVRHAHEHGRPCAATEDDVLAHVRPACRPARATPRPPARRPPCPTAACARSGPPRR